MSLSQVLVTVAGGLAIALLARSVVGNASRLGGFWSPGAPLRSTASAVAPKTLVATGHDVGS